MTRWAWPGRRCPVVRTRLFVTDISRFEEIARRHGKVFRVARLHHGRSEGPGRPRDADRDRSRRVRGRRLSLALKRSRKLEFTVGVLVAGFVGLNFLAYSHARTMTHFLPGGLRTGRPETLVFLQKVKVVALGVQLPQAEEYGNAPRPSDALRHVDHAGGAGDDPRSLGDSTTRSERRGRAVPRIHDRKSSDLTEARAFFNTGWAPVSSTCAAAEARRATPPASVMWPRPSVFTRGAACERTPGHLGGLHGRRRCHSRRGRAGPRGGWPRPGAQPLTLRSAVVNRFSIWLGVPTLHTA